MEWKAFFDDGSTKELEGEQSIIHVCKEYIDKLKITPLCFLIDNLGYSLRDSFLPPKKNIKIRIIHTELPKIKIAASYTIGDAIKSFLSHHFKNQKVFLKEFGKGHFVISIYNINKKELVNFIKKILPKHLQIILNKKDECDFNNVTEIFKIEPNYNKLINLFSYDDLKNHSLLSIKEINDYFELSFKFFLDEKSIFLKTKKQQTFDHRLVGAELSLFYFKSESSPGMPYWLPNGLILKNEIKNYLREQQKKQGFLEVETPIIGLDNLYKKSGHLQHYKNEMYAITNNKKEILFLRPMACPHHCDIFKRIPRSYKDLPFKLCEYAKLYRKEASGGLIGLERVTSMELSDAHIFCKESDIKQQIKESLELIEETLKNLGISIHQYTIAIRDYFDNKSYGGDKELWKKAENKIIELANEMNLNYKIIVGEAAFYGPKIDLEVISIHSMNLSTISTIQLDFFLPKRYDLTYLDKNKQKHYVVMIHRGLASTFERLISFMLTQNGGYFPLRFAPTQIEIIPITLSSKKIIDYCKLIREKLINYHFRINLNLNENTLGKKIRNFQKKKINYCLIVGEQEVEQKLISIRKYKSKETKKMSIENFLKELKKEISFLEF